MVFNVIFDSVRCDSADQASNICSHCISFNLECTHRMAEARVAKRTGKQPEERNDATEVSRPTSLPAQPPVRLSIHLSDEDSTQSQQQQASVQLEECDIEDAKAHISAILSTSYKLTEDHAQTLKVLVQISCYARHLEGQVAHAVSASPPAAPSLRQPSNSPEPENLPRPIPFLCDLPRLKEDEAERDIPLSEPLRQLHFGFNDAKDAYYGKGSNVMLLKTAFNIKAGSSGKDLSGNSSKRPDFWGYFPNYIIFLQPTTSGDLTWPLVALGLRYAHVAGAHRRHFMQYKPLAEQELWKRAFWVLIAIDTYSSAFYGRPRCTTPIDYNQEFPLEVDDEYWEDSDPDKCFKQPPDKPSTITFWVQFLKILRVLGIAQRSYLRWKPDQPDSVFFNQSATIHSVYYWIQIQIHRPFISVPGHSNKFPNLSYSSLAVCSNAARSCIRLLDIQSKKGTVDWTTAQMSLYSSAMVLTLNLWGNSRSIAILKRFETRWQKAGGLVDIITEILAITEVPTANACATKKRSRSDDNDNDECQVPQQEQCSVDVDTTPQYPPYSDDWWLNAVLDASPSAGDVAGYQNYIELPLYTEDLSGSYFDTISFASQDGAGVGQHEQFNPTQGSWDSSPGLHIDPGSNDVAGNAVLTAQSLTGNEADLWLQAIGGDPYVLSCRMDNDGFNPP
ncbi:Gypsy retrotransposon integrase-like protein 1 [Marasmius tenuissimus]|uniref:Gypsy retrotransposon integrase-like protein 1 n=1 Tax=Marasmius tenuissimus TaxID=585030 RepID=A0ABR3A6J1_9AGAR